MFSSVCPSRHSSLLRFAAIAAVVLPGIMSAPQASAQTSSAPQLLPYTARLTAGSGTTANTAGVACAAATGAAASGYTSYDVWNGGCLGNEIYLSNPQSMITDPNGIIYFTDYATSARNSAAAKTGVVHRLDPITGIVTTIAGSGKTIASGAACSTSVAADKNTAKTGDVFGDGCLATSVLLQEPTGLAFSADGKSLYVVDKYAYNVRSVSLNNGGVSAVAIVNGGSGYAAAPTVTFSAPTSGTTATGTTTINSNGVVTGVTITNAGSGYTAAPTVTFSVPGTGTNTATGNAVYAGVISMLVGGANGASSSAYGFWANGAGCNLATTTTAGGGCALDAVFNVAVDKNGLVYLPDEFYESILVANPTTTNQTAFGITIPAGYMKYVAGYRGTSGCTNGTGTDSPTSTSGNGCGYGSYANGGNALASTTQLDAPYNVALDTYGNAYITNEYPGNVALISAGGTALNGAAATLTADTITTFAGAQSTASHTFTKTPASTRGVAASFVTGNDYGIGLDYQNNVYYTDSTAGVVWRVDALSSTQFAVAGGGNGGVNYTGAGIACAGTPTNVSATTTDKFGDGCPGLSATFNASTAINIFTPNADNASNLYVADTYNYLYREFATGANFGNTGAVATDYLDIHFQNGDTPATTSPFVITTGTAIFTVGTPVCTTNTDNNSSYSNSTDCIVPITASPTVSGAYSGVLTVTSKKNTPVLVPLNGYFAQSPITRTSVSYTASAGSACNSTTYATTTSFTFTAKITANGPTAPTGTIQFANNGTNIGSPQAVVNLGTTTAPVYGAIYTTTFPTAGPQSVTATYIPAPSSGTFTEYYVGSTSAPATLTTATPAFTTTPIISNGATSATYTVAAGGTGLYSFNVAATVYTGTVTFSCAGLPAGTSCVFSPASITGAGCTTSSTVAVNIYTTAPLKSSPAGFGGTRGPWSMMGLFAGVLLATCVGLFRRRLPMRAGQMLMAVALLLSASGLVACSKASGTVLSPGTPSGNYTIAINAAGTDGTTNSFNVTLIVQ